VAEDDVKFVCSPEVLKPCGVGRVGAARPTFMGSAIPLRPEISCSNRPCSKEMFATAEVAGVVLLLGGRTALLAEAAAAGMCLALLAETRMLATLGLELLVPSEIAMDGFRCVTIGNVLALAADDAAAAAALRLVADDARNDASFLFTISCVRAWSRLGLCDFR